ncbi:MAG: gliding motility lipoprotein GldD [Flavobacteriales bacterium]|nr:gliding motility lipoprotein GldD [Flavobacteriales bacterium]
MKIKFLFISLVAVLSSCSENYSPKPLGYFRIDLSEKEYQIFDSKCSYQFLSPKDVKIISGKNNCWYNIYYPSHDATVYLTYKMLDSNLASIIEESHKLAYDHAVRSDGIIEKVYLNEEEQVYGVLYDIHGNSASNLQFFATDSANHFLRGSLYFNTIPNSDSLQPVKDYIKEDLQTLIESLKWS